MMNVKCLRMLGASALVALCASGVQAATCTQGSVKYTLTQGSPDAVLSYGCFAGNDTNTIKSDKEFLGVTGWMLGDKTDDGNEYGKLDFATFTSAPAYGWSLANPENYGTIMVTLKQANTFAAFILDTTKLLAGTWFTEGPGKSKGDISHASVYFAGSPRIVPPPPPPVPVPLPAAGLLLIASLGGLVGASRRRR